jgi:hypothetical protein
MKIHILQGEEEMNLFMKKKEMLVYSLKYNRNMKMFLFKNQVEIPVLQ